MSRCKFPELIVLLVLGLAGCGGAEDRKAAYFEKGQALFKEGNYDKARLEFKNVLQIDPKDVSARFALAETLEKQQDWRGAAGHYLGVVEAAPEHKSALSKMAQIYLLSRNTEEAKKLAERLLKLDPKDPDGLTVQASIKALDKNIEGALNDVRAALAASPGNLNASALLASLLLQTNKPDDSVATLKTAIEKNPGNTTAQSLLARVYAQIGRNDEAARMFEEIAAAEPKYLGHRLRLAQFLAQTKNLDKAEEVLNKAVAEIKDDRKEANTAKLSLIEFLAANRSGDEAITQLGAYVKADPENTDLRMALGKVHETANQNEKARDAYKDVIARFEDPKSPPALVARTRLAVVLGRLGDKAESRKTVEAVLKDNPRDRDALVLRGTLLVDEKDIQSAIADFRAALKDEPNLPDINRILARAHLLNEEPQLAIDTLKKAIEGNPDDVQMRADLANIYSSQKDLDSALAQLEDIARVKPDNKQASEGMFKIHVYRKDWEKAHALADRLKSAQPEDPTGFYFDGLAYQGENKPEESIEQFESALAVSPDAVQPLSQLIKSHLALRKADIAAKRLEEVIERNPKNFVALNLAGELHLAEKRNAEARDAFFKALEVNKEWAILYRNMAAAQLALKDESGAIKTMEEGIEATKGSALLVTGLASFYERTGKLDDAIAQYERVLTENPKSDLALNNLAMLLAEYRDDEQSRKRAKTLSDQITDRTESAYLDTIGWVAYKQGDYQSAADTLEKAVQSVTEGGIMHYHLGMAYLKLGNDVLAKDNLRKAIDGGQSFRGLEEAKSSLATLEGTN